MNIHDIMQLVVDRQGSDIHLNVETPPMLRVDGILIAVEGAPVLTQELSEKLIMPLLTQEQKDYVRVNKELDFGYQFQDKGRFRINVFHAMGTLGAAMRLIPDRVKSLDELNLPPIMSEFINFNQGLILLTGPTGEGKSTTLAALIDMINKTRSEHIVTIEDPIEFRYRPNKSIITQREIRHDTNSWQVALRSVLREDPDVVLIGEMRDFETIASAITIAETGNLVFATLHTATAAETMSRIIDVFPAGQQGQIRQQLAATVKAVASQRLLPAIGGGRRAAMEIMLANSAIRNLIREEKEFQIDTVMQTSAESGMMLFETHLMQLIQQGIISQETALERAFRPIEMARLLEK
ncbi:MAG: type IV pili twitching motility protein PilT [Candidatus Pacebacteria bacterium RIFCSPLOWO2_01_FULL_47_12]|nr:MAG: type IV pili twitching motility protein PilT [Candidatus Pacebacteria bacterium RIFCSPHIGHO2_02_FULL_46_9]OGJ37635.1 MAG: type IV pili twitching motility protein PilT [Candidatus Pacebacteria bacterium RIFCSPLOWO2_01_FULL_47_12]